jgi:sialic acid synthase SpsE
MTTNSKDKKTLLFKNYYIFTDTCFHHEGDFDYLLELIKLSAQGKADGVKFQILLDLDDYYTEDAKRIPESFIFTEQQWKQAIGMAKKLNLNVILMPLCNSAVNFAKKHVDLISAIEIHSINLNDIFLLREIKGLKVPILLSVGGRMKDEILFALKEIHNPDRITYLMYGFQSFPTDYFELNLNKLKELAQMFKLPIGYADHTSYSDDYGKSVVDIAFVNGAKIFEFHITKHKGKSRVDFEAAYSFKDLLDIRERLKKISRILGDESSLLKLSESERKYRGREKQIVVRKLIQENEIITLDHLTYKIAPEESDFKQSEIENLVGKSASRVLDKDKVLKYKDVQD